MLHNNCINAIYRDGNFEKCRWIFGLLYELIIKDILLNIKKREILRQLKLGFDIALILLIESSWPKVPFRLLYDWMSVQHKLANKKEFEELLSWKYNPTLISKKSYHEARNIFLLWINSTTVQKLERFIYLATGSVDKSPILIRIQYYEKNVEPRFMTCSRQVNFTRASFQDSKKFLSMMDLICTVDLAESPTFTLS